MEQLAWQKRVHQLRMLLYKQPNLVIHLSFKIAVWICKEKTEKRKRQHCWCFFNFSHIIISYSCVLCVLHSSFIFWYSLCSLPTTYVNSCKCDLQLLSEFEKKKKTATVEVFLTYIIFFLCALQKLIGYCSSKSHLFLVYEFAEGGSVIDKVIGYWYGENPFVSCVWIWGKWFCNMDNLNGIKFFLLCV